MSFTCKDCNSKVYVSQYALNRHRKEVHGQFDLRIQTYPFETFNHKCLEGCTVSFKTTKDLRQHLSQKHAILMQQAIFEFDNASDFLSWKANLNKNPNQQYVNTYGQKKNGNLEMIYYYCHNTQTALPEVSVEESERTLNLEESSKLHASCTSEMLVVKNLTSKMIVVTYFKTHYGHDSGGNVRTPTNYATRKVVMLTSKIPERILEEPIPTNSTKRRKKPSEKKISQKRKKQKVTQKNIQHTEQHSENYLNSEVRYEIDQVDTNSPEDQCGNKKTDNKTTLKKDIIYLLQKLSDNDLDDYDENTLSQVRETLNDCCYFLSTYQKPEEPELVEESPPVPLSSPPELVWFSPQDD